MITLVTGGARSGKSSFAENIYKGKKDVVYIATSRAEDVEMKERVKKHKSGRPDFWRTYEGTYDIEKAVGSEENYILDCITVLTSNVMFDMSKDLERISGELEKNIEDRVVEIIEKLIKKSADKNIVMVTNEVGSSIVPENHIARVFRDIAGRVNQRVAALSDEVYVVFCGISLKLK
ncbi:bifunctional adenosylcobinamide kinase/adenosylcobinamide-phosphate guanylyltransferase [Clostridium hydrogenum]|uniref:bifunctional adenosylcobinamide kinase/adenosylcobinamide-phosphate guanylyltransferase n=1 Tax=Clostridium hydrogenum TaxID=2855764 RepID=UPI001F2CAB16|nr:bifunctional adenosylcobinamide kinase/adenosylcobinamide-phosphate guanylyltransferase [Clostridium hydrogenum]